MYKPWWQQTATSPPQHTEMVATAAAVGVEYYNQSDDGFDITAAESAGTFAWPIGLHCSLTLPQVVPSHILHPLLLFYVLQWARKLMMTINNTSKINKPIPNVISYWNIPLPIPQLKTLISTHNTCSVPSLSLRVGDQKNQRATNLILLHMSDDICTQ